MTRLCSKGCGRRAVRRNWCSSHYNQQRDRLIAYGRWETLYVDAEPARNHVRNLQSAGLGLRRIAELGAISRSQLVALLKGRPDRGTGPLLVICDHCCLEDSGERTDDCFDSHEHTATGPACATAEIIARAGL